jgi:hypothetical protein
MADSSLPLTCCCGQPMQRVYTVPQFSIDKRDYFDYGLGIHVKNKSDIDNKLRELRDGKTNGRDVWRKDEYGKKYCEKVDVPPMNVQEIGNENLKTKPAHQDYDLPKGAI